MKTGIKNPLVHSVLIAVLGLVLVDRVTAQTFTTLHSFSAISNSWPYGNSDGSEAFGGLVISGKTLYGTTQLGGSYGKGTVFALNTDGTGFTNLHSFTDIDGANLQAGLILLGNTLYGTAQGGGSSGNGTLFAVNVNGGGFTNLHIFTPIPFPDYTNSDGAYPFAGLILSGNTLYGTAWMGGVFGYGTVFAVNTDGTGFTTLHSFTALNNSDGANPIAGLILS